MYKKNFYSLLEEIYIEETMTFDDNKLVINSVKTAEWNFLRWTVGLVVGLFLALFLLSYLFNKSRGILLIITILTIIEFFVLVPALYDKIILEYGKNHIIFDFESNKIIIYYFHLKYEIKFTRLLSRIQGSFPGMFGTQNLYFLTEDRMVSGIGSILVTNMNYYSRSAIRILYRIFQVFYLKQNPELLEIIERNALTKENIKLAKLRRQQKFGEKPSPLDEQYIMERNIANNHLSVTEGSYENHSGGLALLLEMHSKQKSFQELLRSISYCVFCGFVTDSVNLFCVNCGDRIQ